MLKKSAVLEILDLGGIVTWTSNSSLAFVWSSQMFSQASYFGAYPLRWAKALAASGKYRVCTISDDLDGRIVYYTRLFKSEEV